MKYEYKETYKIRNHEIDQEHFITIPALLLIMQDASMLNAEQLKLTYWDMKDLDASWVLLRKQMEVFSYPKRSQVVTVQTYPAGFDRVLAYRDFFVYSDENKLLAQASSTWTLMNMTTRKLMRIPEEFNAFVPEEKEQCLPVPVARMPELSSITFKSSYFVRKFDLDWNGHVNNVVLSRLVMDSLPKSFQVGKEASHYTIHIKSECFINEKLEVQFYSDGEMTSNHKIIGEDNRLIAIAKTEWRERS